VKHMALSNQADKIDETPHLNSVPLSEGEARTDSKVGETQCRLKY